MTALDKQELEKKYIISLLIDTNGYSIDFLKDKSLASLKKLYNKYFSKPIAAKAKLSTNTYNTTFKIPVSVVRNLGITYGDRFNLKRNVDKNELYLDRTLEGQFKVRGENVILFPITLAEKRWIKANETVLVKLDRENDRIILKYMD